jgi:hypothetical protein
LTSHSNDADVSAIGSINGNNSFFNGDNGYYQQANGLNSNPNVNSNYASSQSSTYGGNILNTSNLTFDLMNNNNNTVKTRYDVKSIGSGSLYGSRVNINKEQIKSYITITLYFF